MKAKSIYFLSSLKKRLLFQGNTCPSCGCKAAKILESKLVVTDLRRCDNCKLLFRTPTTTESESFKFYQKSYMQGFTTDCPTDKHLQELIKIKFYNTAKDYTKYIDILESLGAKPGQRLLDYGCSWGYGTWQFKQVGYEVVGFEVSKSRCQYGREKLEIDAKDCLENIKGDFDIIFSSHVIEHLPCVSTYLKFAIKHLRPGGILLTICPNGSESFRASDSRSYSKLWGLCHPQFLDEQFYIEFFQKSYLFITSSPYDLSLFRNWDKKSFFLGNLLGCELISVWVKPYEEIKGCSSF